jgi:hypothetical protein
MLGKPSVRIGELNSKLISSQSSFDAGVFTPWANRQEVRIPKRTSNAAYRWHFIDTPPLCV